MSAAPDADQAYIRRSGAVIALIHARLAIPPSGTLSLKPRTLAAAQVDAALARTDRAVAGHLLAELITDLPVDLLELVRGDQVTDDAILGCPVPEPARPVLRALDHSCVPVLHQPTPTNGRTARPRRMANRPSPVGDTDTDAFATATELLLRGPGESIPACALSPAVRVQLDELAAEEILELERGVYRASDIALYSCYELRFPPLRATDIQARRPADIGRESR